MSTFPTETRQAITSILDAMQSRLFPITLMPSFLKKRLIKHVGYSYKEKENDCYLVDAKCPGIRAYVEMKLQRGPNAGAEIIKAKCRRTFLGKLFLLSFLLLTILGSREVYFSMRDAIGNWLIPNANTSSVGEVFDGGMKFLFLGMPIIFVTTGIFAIITGGMTWFIFYLKTLYSNIITKKIPNTLNLVLKNEKSFVIPEQTEYSLKGLNSEEIAKCALKELPLLIPEVNATANCQLAPNIEQPALTKGLSLVAPGISPEDVIAIIDFPVQFAPAYANALFITKQGLFRRPTIFAKPGIGGENFRTNYKDIKVLIPFAAKGHYLRAKTSDKEVILLESTAYAKIPLLPYNEGQLRTGEILTKFISAMQKAN